MASSPRPVDLAQAALAPFLVGAGVAVSGLLVSYPALLSQGGRYLIGALVLALVFRRRVLPPQWPHGRALGLLAADVVIGLGLFSVASIEALRGGTAAGVGVIVGFAPVVIALGHTLLSHTRLRAGLLVGTVVATAGAVLVNGAGHLSIGGLAWALTALVCDASFTLLSAPLIDAVGILPLTFLTAGAAGLGLLILGLVLGPAPSAPTLTEVVADLAVALGVTVGAFLLWFRGLAAVGVPQAAPMVALIPVGAFLGGVALGTTPLSVRAGVGVLVVALGIVIAQRSSSRHPDDLSTA